MRLWAVVIAILALGLPAQAESYLKPRESYRLFIFGDSLAGRVLETARLAAQGGTLLAVDGRVQDESGLARPEIHNWPEALPKIQETNGIDIAVMMLGVNDSQPIRFGEQGFAFGSVEWRALYRERTEAVMRILKKPGTAVYWLGLPPLGSGVLQQNMALISQVQREAAAAHSIRYIDLASAFGGQEGLVAPNGLELTRAGEEKAAEVLLSALRADADAAQQENAALAGVPLTPLFGQMISAGDSGAQGVFRPAYRPPSLSLNNAVAGADGLALLARLAEDAKPGSNAEKLFRQGLWPQARPGRMDDFSAAALTGP